MDKVRQTRQIQRSSRQKVPYPVVALVGYTNAGKSSLFNQLSAGHVLAKDMLFATLDPAMRRLKLPSGRIVILSDTVGFISDLPHELIMAFRATLEEVLQADVIIHVRDASNPNAKEQKQDVLKVLENLGLQHMETDQRYIEVLNKVDLLSVEERGKLPAGALPLSALTGEGAANLLNLLDERLAIGYKVMEFSISAADGKKIAWLHQNAEIISARSVADKMVIKVRISAPSAAKLQKMLSNE